MRIASLLPSATEICCALGLRNQLVGVSHECDFPEYVQGLPVLTAPKLDPHTSAADIDRQVRALVADGLSVYDIYEDRLRELRPDLIVTQDTCQVCAVSLDDVRGAAQRIVGSSVEVLSLSPLNLEDVLEDISRVGDETGTRRTAGELVARLRRRLEALRKATITLPHPRTLMLEWLDPPMVAGHWTPELIQLAGGDPILGHPGEPTTSTTWQAIADASPEFILIAPCGFKIEQTLRELPALRALPEFACLSAVERGQFAIADGNAYFNRPGPRLVESAEIAAVAIHGIGGVRVPAGALLTF